MSNERGEGHESDAENGPREPARADLGDEGSDEDRRRCCIWPSTLRSHRFVTSTGCSIRGCCASTPTGSSALARQVLLKLHHNVPQKVDRELLVDADRTRSARSADAALQLSCFAMKH
jgi:hypothetical protein